MGEPDLIRRSQQGDRAAFEALFRSWVRPLYAYLLPQVRDVQLAEDLAQETLFRAWKSIRSLDDPAKFKGWLFAIAHRALLDSARSNARTKRLRLTSLQSEPPSRDVASPTPEQEALLDALSRLPESYRAALSLRFLSGLSHEQIEARLGVTNGSLRGLLHRGLAMLRDELDVKQTTTDPNHETRP